MCSVLTRGSQHQPQLWQGSLVVPKMVLRRDEALSPHNRPTDVSSGNGGKTLITWAEQAGGGL